MKIKSFAKRSVSIMLTILLVVSMFAVVATTVSAAEVDVAQTGANKTIYFTLQSDYWWEPPYIHIWKNGGSNLTTWPGWQMTYTETNSYGQKVYEATFSDEYDRIIFNNGGSVTDQTQTIDISNVPSGTGYYVTGGDVKNRTVASFEYDVKETYSVNAYAYTNGSQSTTGGTVSVSSSSVEEGSTVTFTATPKTGYEFKGWYTNTALTTAAAGGTNTSYTYTVNANTTWYAKFVSKSYSVSAVAYTDGVASDVGGTASVSSSSVTYNGTATFTAVANDGYNFTGWYTSPSATTATSTANPYTKTITSATTLYAKFVFSRVVTPPASVSIVLDEDTNTITAVASGGTVDGAAPESYTYVLYKDKKAVDTNTTGIFTYESSEDDASYYVKAYPETYEGYATSSETVTVEAVAQFTTPIVSASSTYVAPGESYTITAYVPGITGATYTLYDFSGNMITANTKGTFAMTAQNSIGDYSYYVVATLGELSSQSDNITIHVVSETQTSLTVKVLFKSTDTYGYETYATVGSAKTQMTKAAANAALNIPENLGTNSTQTATYYWYETTATVTKGEKVTIVFTSNRYNLNASITVTFNYSGTYFFAADDLNNSLTAVDLTNVTPAQRNWVQSANHMVYNPEKDGALPSTGADIEIAVSGDVDYDSKLTIKDVTLIQRRLAQIVAFNDAQEASADYNGDGIVSILDASVIQRELVNR